MIVIGLVAILAGLAAMCWICFTLAAYALPVLCGVFAGRELFALGIGAFPALLGGVLVAMIALAAGHLGLVHIRSPWVRLGIALLFVVPAAFAGYHATLGLIHLIAAAGPREPFVACLGGAATAIASLAKVANLARPTETGEAVAA